MMHCEAMIRVPRWYQFWRWHLITKYKRQRHQAYEEFKKDFGAFLSSECNKGDWAIPGGSITIDRKPEGGEI